MNKPLIKTPELAANLNWFFGDIIYLEQPVPEPKGKNDIIRGWLPIPDRLNTDALIHWYKRNRVDLEHAAKENKEPELDEHSSIRLIPKIGRMARPMFDLKLYTEPDTRDEEYCEYVAGWMLQDAYSSIEEGGCAWEHSLNHIPSILYYIQKYYMEFVVINPPELTQRALREILLRLLWAEVKDDPGTDQKKSQVFYTMRVLQKFFLYHIGTLTSIKENMNHLEDTILAEYKLIGMDSYSQEIVELAAKMAVEQRENL